MLWSAVSKAADKSRMMSIVHTFLLDVEKGSVSKMTMALQIYKKVFECFRCEVK